MNDAEFELIQIFLEQAKEYLSAIEDNLVGLDPQELDFRQKVDRMLDSAHALKVGAMSRLLDSLSTGSQRLEEALQSLNCDRPRLNQEILGLFFQGIEQLHQLVLLNRKGELWVAEPIELVFDRLQQKLQDSQDTAVIQEVFESSLVTWLDPEEVEPTQESSPFNLEQITDANELFETTQLDATQEPNTNLLNNGSNDSGFAPFLGDRTVIIDYIHESPSEFPEFFEEVAVNTSESLPESMEPESMETRSDEPHSTKAESSEDELVVIEDFAVDRELIKEVFFAEQEIFLSADSSDMPFAENPLVELLVENLSPEYSNEYLPEHEAEAIEIHTENALTDVETEKMDIEVDSFDRNPLKFDPQAAIANSLVGVDLLGNALIDVVQITHYQEMFLDNDVEISEIFTYEPPVEAAIESAVEFKASLNPNKIDSKKSSPSKSNLSNSSSESDLKKIQTFNQIDSEPVEMDDAFWHSLDRMLDNADSPKESWNYLISGDFESALMPSGEFVASDVNPDNLADENLSSSEIYQIEAIPVALTSTALASTALVSKYDEGGGTHPVRNRAELELETKHNERIPEIASDFTSTQFRDNVRLPVSQLENLSRLADGLVISKSNLDIQLSRLKDLSRVLQRNVRSLDDSQDELHATCNHIFDRLDAQDSQDESHLRQSLTRVLPQNRATQVIALSQSVTAAIAQLAVISEGINLALLEAEQEAASVGHEFSQLVTSINHAKLQPFSELVSWISKGIGDLSLKYDKQVELRIKGGETLIDRAIANALIVPIQHLLHYAFARGIEDSSTRKALGKQEYGAIEITANQTKEGISITVRDDGRGLDLEKIRTRIMQASLRDGVDPSTATQVSSAKIVSFIFEPYFSAENLGLPQSTQTQSTQTKGMEAIHANLDRIGADIAINSELGKGTRFTIAIPNKFPTLKVLLLQIDRMFLAAPWSAVKAVVPFSADGILVKNGERLFVWEDREVPIVRLSDRLKLNCHLNRKQSEYKPPSATPSILILEHDRNLMAISVDACWGKQQARLHNIEGDISLPDAFSGCLILESGQPVVLLSPAEIFLQWLSADQTSSASMVYSPQSTSLKRTVNFTSKEDANNVVLIVDDSIQTRRNLVTALEKAGFKTEQAKDGEDALLKIRSGIHVDAIVSDIEMPHIDGYGMLSRLKESEASSHLPVIFLATSDDETHRQHAMALGAVAYFCEPYEEEELIQTLKQQLEIKS